MQAVKLCYNRVLKSFTGCWLTQFDLCSGCKDGCVCSAVLQDKVNVLLLLFLDKTRVSFVRAYFVLLCLTDHVLDFVVLRLQTSVPDLLLSSQILEARVKLYLQF